ncbi:MAG TPA: tetratricopeptide repeat protein [Candidatus Obscuribacterales bacterium]
MTTDKKLIISCLLLVAVSFAAGLALAYYAEIEGSVENDDFWLYLNKTYLARLAKLEAKDPKSAQEDLGRTLHNVGTSYLNLRQYERAEGYFLRALEIKWECKKFPGSSAADTMQRLGGIYRHVAKYQQSKVFSQRALELFEKTEDAKCIHVAIVNEELGSLYALCRDHRKAAKHLKTAAGIYHEQNDLGAESRCRSILALLYSNTDRKAKAEAQLKLASELLSSKWGSGFEQFFDRDIAFYKMALARLFLVDGKFADAQRYYQSSYEVLKNALGEKSPTALNCQFLLSQCYSKLGKKDAAVAALSTLVAAFQSMKLEDHPQCIEALERQSELLVELNQVQAASQLTEKIAILRTSRLAKDKLDEESAREQIFKLKPQMEDWLHRDAFDAWALPIMAALIAWSFTGLVSVGLACATVANAKHHSGVLWFFVGIVFSVLALAMILALPAEHEDRTRTVRRAIIEDALLVSFLLSASPLLVALLVFSFPTPVLLRDTFVALGFAWFVAFTLTPALWCWFVADVKGRNKWLWGALGLLFSVFALYLILAVAPTRENEERAPESLRLNPVQCLTLLTSAATVLTLLGSLLTAYSQISKHIEW